MYNDPNLPPFIQHHLQQQRRKKKKERNTIIVVAVIGFILLGIISSQIDKKEKQANIENAKKDISAKSPTYQYDILKQENNGNGNNEFQNLFVFIKTSNKSEAAIKQIASKLKNKLCNGRCNLSLYDDSTSYLLENKLNDAEKHLGNELTDGKISKARYLDLYAGYEKKYYVTLADHLVGQILIDADNVDYYPMRDSRYKELGGTAALTVTTLESTSSEQTKPQTENIAQLSKDDQDSKARDAVAILEVYVKQNMNDADSFEEVSYDYSYHGTYFIILLKYRGKNGFGAKVINYIKAKTDLDGNVIAVLDE